MNPVILLLAVMFQFHGIICDGGLSINPTVNCNCDCEETFISSAAYNGKVFLHPRILEDRRADWHEARGYCAANCAEMVTIHSSAENTFFLNFMRSIGLSDAVWLGAQINNKADFALWSNGEPGDYNNKRPGEYDDAGLTCLNAASGVTNDYWYSYNCANVNFFVACQRPGSYKPLQAPPCYDSNDLIVLLDSSGSIGSTNYETAKSFVNELVRAFKVQSTNRIGFILYSDVVDTVIGLTNTLSLAGTSSAIINAPYLNSITNTDLGIDAAVAEFISSPRLFPRNLVVLTDGVSTDPTLTLAAALAASTNGIRTFSVGIGSSINSTELLAIANGDTDRVFTTSSFDDLVDLLDPIGTAVCEN